jgi:hypothetical protein
MNVEIGTEAAQFPEKEYINGIFLAVYATVPLMTVIEKDGTKTDRNTGVKVVKETR